MFSFFDFGESAAEKSLEETPVRVEFARYLNAVDASIESLNRYPTIKSAFFRYNTPLPSSAPVERLFSYAGLINGPKRQSLSDSHFEQLVLLKANKIF
ncbi:hypothetical protein ACLKA6_004593 [Drosophila palustris]